jgi:hypothetical protein
MKAPKLCWIYVHHIGDKLHLLLEWSSYMHKLYNRLSGLAYGSSSLVLHHAIYVEISNNPQKSNTSPVARGMLPSAECKSMNWVMCYSTSKHIDCEMIQVAWV